MLVDHMYHMTAARSVFLLLCALQVRYVGYVLCMYCPWKHRGTEVIKQICLELVISSYCR